ncbi:MAG: uracil-DNA glycosylase [Clostridia bacterium]|nr:uracil-DNA glycosylase [Clostridia bacterium]
MEKTLSALRDEAMVCRACRLCETRKNVVFGRGSEHPRIMFIGEAPGEQEDLQGLPFVGAAGQLLQLYLDYLGLEDEDYYIANILKCRPPRNRDPLPEEEQACIGKLRDQVKLLAPKVIVCLGRIAACRIISPDFRITREHGKWFDRGGMRVMATFHPSALLRDPTKKEAALLDFKSILNEI